MTDLLATRSGNGPDADLWWVIVGAAALWLLSRAAVLVELLSR